LRREAATLIIKLKHALERALAARKLIRHWRAPPRCVRGAPGDQLSCAPPRVRGAHELALAQARRAVKQSAAVTVLT
jgi:hypothetical protein